MTCRRQIVFTSRKIPNNSFTMRGEQIAHQLRLNGYNAVCIEPNRLSDIKDSIVFWVRRTHKEKTLQKLHDNNNYQILDILDRIFECDLDKQKIISKLDCILFASRKTYSELNGKDKYYILHHHDPVLQKREYNSFQLGYWGYRTAACHVNNVIRNSKFRIRSARAGEYPSQEWFEGVSCHYSVKDYKRGLGWRPATKIATASACGANIIVSREPIAEELLPHDYPYFVDDPSYETTRTVIQYAKVTYGNDIWKYGLRCMESARHLTTVNKAAKLYGRIIDDIDRRIY